MIYYYNIKIISYEDNYYKDIYFGKFRQVNINILLLYYMFLKYNYIM